MLVTRLLLASAVLARALAAVDRRDAFVGYHESKAAAVGCKDSSENCVDWAARGECDSNAGFMHTGCARACGTCAPPSTELQADWTGDVVELSTSVGAIRIAVRGGGPIAPNAG